MKRSVKQVIKVLTLSGALGALGGLLSPPRLKGSKGVSLPPDPSIDDPIVETESPVTDEAIGVTPTQEIKPKKASSSKSKTAAATKPKPSSTARIPKSSKVRSDTAKDDQSGGSEK